MNKLITIIFALLILTAGSYAQTAMKTDAVLEASMKKFINSIQTKNATVFLSYISPAKGLTVMNTIEQNGGGNANNPAFDSKTSYKAMAVDFKKKGELYRSIFTPSEDSPNFHDAFANAKTKWALGADNKFMMVDEADGKPVNGLYVKWAKQSNRWFVEEVGRPIS